MGCGAGLSPREFGRSVEISRRMGVVHGGRSGALCSRVLFRLTNLEVIDRGR